MEEGQNADQHVGVAEVNDLIDRCDVAADVGVSEQDALGRSGCAAGEQPNSRIVFRKYGERTLFIH